MLAFSRSLSLSVASVLLAAATSLPASVLAQSYVPIRVPNAFTSGTYQLTQAAQDTLQGTTNAMSNQAGSATTSEMSQLTGSASQDGPTPSSLWPTPGSPGAGSPMPGSPPGAPGQAIQGGQVGVPVVPVGPRLPPLSDSVTATQMWSFDPSQELRQSGQSMGLANHRGVTSLTDYSTRVWLEEWHRQLTGHGLVSEDHFWFQARRLNKSDFALWASRQVWAGESTPISSGPISSGARAFDSSL